MSTKKEKPCCEKCRGEDGEIAPFCITRVCPCHSQSERTGFELDNGSMGVSASTHIQSESIEWDTELDEKYGERNIFGGLWVMDGEKLGQWRLVNDDVRMILRRAITTAVAKREKELVEEVEKMKRYHKEFECNGAFNGKGCYESWCEDQECRNAPKEYNQAITDVLSLIKH